MNLLAHITPPDSIALAAMFALGLLAGAALMWIGQNLWIGRR